MSSIHIQNKKFDLRCNRMHLDEIVDRLKKKNLDLIMQYKNIFLQHT